MRLIRLLPKSVFARSVGLLTGGTILSQAILALGLPVLTRLYSPEDFNVLAAYASILGLITVVSCLRFNIAIPLGENDGVALNLLVLALVSTTGVCVLVTLLVLFASEEMATVLRQPAMIPHLWLIPVGVLLASSYDALQYWASRKRRFALVAQTRVSRAIGGAATQMGIGAVSASPFGLILGHAVYSGMGVFGLAFSLVRHDWRATGHSLSWESLKSTARTYRKFPQFSVPEALFNTAGVELSVLIIAAVAAGPEAGFLMLAMRVMGLPMGLIGSSVGQVYLAEAPQRLSEGELGPFTRRTMWVLFKTGAPVLAAAALACPLLFPLIFGAEWARAGVLVVWLAPMFILQFVASPVSMLLHVSGKLATAMWMQILGGVIRVCAIAAAARIAPGHVAEAFAISGAIFYAGMIVIIASQVKRLR